MRVEYGQSAVVESRGVESSSAFSIARTPHMFNILSSGLYSDKIGAVLREITCNAVDAHIMAGKPDLPCQVKLPTRLDRTFYVKDWGPGLDDREVRELYTTYGWSSKQNSDDVTGAFGLGSKSPFAYTSQNLEDSDGFTIMAVKDGVKRVYTAHIGDGGAPQVSRIFEGEADDPTWQNGVMVTFPIRERDIPEFHLKAKNIFRWFKVKPEVLGLDGKLVEPEFVLKGSFFRLGSKPDGERFGAGVIMGNVRYPLLLERLSDLSKAESALVQSGINMFLPIGTAMMTPSREELQYTEATKNNIRMWLRKAAIEIAKTIRDNVMADRTNTWNWLKKVQTYYTQLPYALQGNVEAFLELAGVDGEESAYIGKTLRNRSLTVPKFIGAPDADYQAFVYNATEKKVQKRQILSGTFRVARDRLDPVKVDVTQRVVVTYADAASADTRARCLITNDDYDVVILVTGDRKTNLEGLKRVAENIVGPEGLDGAPMQPISSFGEPAALEERRAARRALRELDPEVRAARERIWMVPLSGQQNAKATPISEVEESDRFYVFSPCPSLVTGSSLMASDAGSNTVNRGDVPDFLAAAKEVLGYIGIEVENIAVVKSESMLKRLRLKELGFKPFFQFLFDSIKDPDNQQILLEGVDRRPRIQKHNSVWHMRQYGNLGMFLKEFWDKSKVWHWLLEEGNNSALVTLVREVNDELVVPQNYRVTQSSMKRINALNALHKSLNHRLLKGPVTEMHSNELREFGDAFVPMLSFLQVEEVFGTINKGKAAEAANARRILKLALEADRVLGDERADEMKLQRFLDKGALTLKFL